MMSSDNQKDIMKKFDLAYFKKSYHSLEQQEGREMSDYEIERVLNLGVPHYEAATGNFTYRLECQIVVVNFQDMVIVTVHPGHRPSRSAKLQILYTPTEERIEPQGMDSLANVRKLHLVTEDEEYIDTDFYLSGEYFKKTG